MTEDEKEVLVQESLHKQDSIVYRRLYREIRRLTRFVDMVAYALSVVDDNVPSTYREAVSSPESIQYKLTIDGEIQSLRKNGTW